MANANQKKLSVAQLGQFIDSLVSQEYSVFGPVLRDEAVVYDQISALSDIPVGIEDEQEGGHYRIHKKDHGRYFAYNTGPDTWKRLLFPKEEVLYSSVQEDDSIVFKTSQEKSQKRAFFGVRSCELGAIGIQDRVFIDGSYVDNHYAARRNDLLLIAVNCTQSSATCFCSSLNCGPKSLGGFDLALTEVYSDSEHYFILEVGTEQGAQAIEGLDSSEATSVEVDLADQKISEAASQQTRSINTEGLKEKVYAAMDNKPFWEDLATRCLNCANCTMVCPTCFCSSVDEKTSLDGVEHERVKHWDSCFNLSHSHIAGGSVRVSSDSRYRQWFSHKLASWQDQFDTLGCSGCGRCITWCPVGIDITAEANRLDSVQIQTSQTENN